MTIEKIDGLIAFCTYCRNWWKNRTNADNAIIDAVENELQKEKEKMKKAYCHKTEKARKACRENGKKGGRPAKNLYYKN